MADPYVPPAGNKVALNFGPVYTPPAGNKVGLEFAPGGAPPGDDQYVFPDGWAAGAMGQPGAQLFTRYLLAAPAALGASFGGTAVRNEYRYVAPSGLDAGAFGTAAIKNFNKQAFPTGFVAGAFGTAAHVYNKTQDVRSPGFAAFKGLSNIWVSLGTRRIAAGLGDQSAFGMAAMGGGVRWLDLAGRGIAGFNAGRPTAWFAERQVYPNWFVATRYGAAAVDFNHEVLPEGMDAGAFGQAEVHVPRDYVELTGLGIAGPLWGENRVGNYTRYIAPDPVLPAPTDPEQFGRPEAYLWTRYIEQQFEVTPNDGGVFGHFNLVENRDKTPQPEGIAPGAIGQATVRNNARILTTPPNVDTSVWGDALVAYRIRHVQPTGTDMSQWGSPVGLIVYNDARVLAPTGIAPAGVGEPERVWSNQQTVGPLGYDQSAHGEAFVAFAVRTVAPFRMQDPPPFGLTTVQNWQRQLAPPGLDAGGRGVPTVEEHFTVFAPTSILPPSNQVGDSTRVHNVTPELATFGYVQTLWGDNRLYLQYRSFGMPGFDAVLFGNTLVEHRTKHVAPRSMTPLVVSTKAEVRNVIPDPPGQQPVEVVPGIAPGAVGQASVRDNQIRPPGEDHSHFGNPGVVSMGILPKGITPPYDLTTGSQFGTPFLPATQYVKTQQPTESALYGTPAMWPHYIWAPMGYPFQVGGTPEEQMDERIFGRDHPERPVFGRATVTLRNRTIYPHSNYYDWQHLGEPRTSTNPQYIRAQGSTLSKYGFPVLNGGGVVEPHGFDMAQTGEPAVAFAPYLGPQTVKPGGLSECKFGTAYVDYFNRTLHPQGWIAFTVSPPHTPSWPRRSTWVSNAYPPFPVAGFDASAFGQTWVSHRVREVAPEGMDMALVAQYVPGHFSDRMRVSVQMHVLPVSVAGTAKFGAAAVTRGTRIVRPGPIRAPGFGRTGVKGRQELEPAGIDAGAFGDVQRWEAGKIKPHGDDLAEFGRAVIGQALNPDGFVGHAGSPRIGSRVAPQGVDASAFGEPVALWRGCSQAFIGVPGDGDMTEWGEAEISTNTGPAPVSPT